MSMNIDLVMAYIDEIGIDNAIKKLIVMVLMARWLKNYLDMIV